MRKPEFVYVTYIETTPEKLWEALTDSDFTERYWFDTAVAIGLEGRLAVRAGARNGNITDAGKVVECDPPRRLSYTFMQRPRTKYEDERPRCVDLRARAARQAGEADADP